MGEIRNQRNIVEARPEGRRTRGKPRKTYLDGLEEATKGAGVTIEADCK